MLTEGTILYHGSYCQVKAPDLKKCAHAKDFGRGFYLTTSLEQATNFARLSTRKAIQNHILQPGTSNGFVSVFTLKNIQSLLCHHFATADRAWLHCVVAHRKNSLFHKLVENYAKYDILSGKIANDNTNATIIAYMSGTFGTVGSAQADDICASLMLPERLKDQYCFRTMTAVSCLTFKECIAL